MDFDITRLFTLPYYMDGNPGGEFLLGYLLLAFFIAALFARPLVKKFTPDNKYFRKSMRNKFGKFIFFGITGLILVAARFSAVPFFSMRLWLYLTFGLTIGFAVRTWWQIRGEYADRLDAVEREKKKRGL